MNLKNIRKRHGLTQVQVAKMLGIAQVTYCNYELGNREPDFKTLKKMSNLFHVTIDELIGNENNYFIKEQYTKEEIAIIENIKKLSKEDLLKVEAFTLKCLKKQKEQSENIDNGLNFS